MNENTAGDCFAVAVPYYCALGNITIGFTDCLMSPHLINITKLVDQTTAYESSGLIDPTYNMFNDTVCVLHGLNDTFVLPGRTYSVTYLYLMSSYVA